MQLSQQVRAVTTSEAVRDWMCSKVRSSGCVVTTGRRLGLVCASPIQFFFRV